MNIVARLNRLINSLNLSSTQFADAIGIPRPSLSQILNGRNKKISNEVIAKIHDAFPSLNMMWLLFGEGDMETINIQKSETLQMQTRENVNTPLNDEKSIPDIFSYDNSCKIDESENNNNNELETPEKSQFNLRDKLNKDRIPTNPYSNKQTIDSHFKNDENPKAQETPTILNEAKNKESKEIVSIMIFYSDHTYKVFHPAEI